MIILPGGHYHNEIHSHKHKEMREQLKSECKVQEIYCHTKKIRGREDFFALDYERPVEFYVDLDTSDSPDDTFRKLISLIV